MLRAVLTSDVPPIEVFTDDLITVMDAAGSERAAIFATSECGLVAPMFAATHPDRATGLILCDAWVTFQQTEETPWMYTAEEWEGSPTRYARTWGARAWAEVWSEGQGTGERELDWFARYQRASVAPGALIAETRRFLDTDIRPVLPSVDVPTLVFGEQMTRAPQERSVSSRAASSGARLVELPLAPEGSTGTDGPTRSSRRSAGSSARSVMRRRRFRANSRR